MNNTITIDPARLVWYCIQYEFTGVRKVPQFGDWYWSWIDGVMRADHDFADTPVNWAYILRPVASEQTTGEVTLTPEQQLEWIWQHCRVIFYPGNNEYPIGHCPPADKISRQAIERVMMGQRPKPFDAAGGGA